VGKDNALQSRLERKLDAMLKAAGNEFLPGARYIERAQATHYREVNAPVGNARSPWATGRRPGSDLLYGTRSLWRVWRSCL